MHPATYPGLPETLARFRAMDYDHEFVYHDGALVYAPTGKRYRPEKLRVAGIHHVDSGGGKPHLLFRLLASDGKRGWVAELSDKPAKQGLSAFLEKVLAENKHVKKTYGI